MVNETGKEVIFVYCRLSQGHKLLGVCMPLPVLELGVETLRRTEQVYVGAQVADRCVGAVAGEEGILGHGLSRPHVPVA